MGKKSPPLPATPDYRGAAIEQGQANIETGRLQNRMNNPNIVGPLGGQTVTFGPDDQPTVTQTLTPDAMETLMAQQRVQRRFSELGEQGIAQGSQLLSTPFRPQLSGLTTRLDNPQVRGLDDLNEGNYARGGPSAPQLQQSLGGYGQVRDALGSEAYGVARGGPSNPRLQSPGGYGQVAEGPNLGLYGQAASNVSPQSIQSGPTSGQFGYAAGTETGPTLQRQIDTSGLAAMPVSAGTTGQQAIMSRLEPQLARSEAALRQRLANQGLVAGGEAYNTEMQQAGQQRNDLLSQAALQGINLDLAAQQQGFGQATQQAAFGNQALQNQFGMGVTGRQLGNQAIGQNFGQGQLAQQSANAAQAQDFAQQMGRAGLQNQAVAQNQQTALSQQAANNAAQAQSYQQALGLGQFGNQAALAEFAAAQSAQEAANRSIEQNFGRGMQSAGFQNAAQQQQFNQNLQAGQFGNQSALGEFGAAQSAQAAQNAALQQNQQAALQRQQAQNAAAAQQFNQNLQAGQFGNTAEQQALQQQLMLYQQPLNNISALMSGSQLQMPQFQGYTGSDIAPPPLFAGTQAQGQAAMDRYGIQQSGVNAKTAGLYGLLGAGATAYGLRG